MNSDTRHAAMPTKKGGRPEWIVRLLASPARQALPILSAPGIPMTGASAGEAYRSSKLLFEAVRAIAETYPMPAAVTMMDLSVEAEAFGAPVRFEERAAPTVTAAIVRDAAEIEALAIPSLDAGRLPETLRCAELCARHIGDRPTLGGLIGPFSLACRLAGTTEMMMMTMLAPEDARRLLRKTAAFLTAYALALKERGIGGLLMAEPAAGLISPEMNAAFVTPRVAEIVDAVQDAGFAFVLHNCGNTLRQIGDWVATGAAGLHVGNAVRMEEIVPQVPGDVLIAGNLDPARLFRNGTPEEVARAARELLALVGDHANFVISSGCDVPEETPAGNLRAFFAAVEEHAAGRGEGHGGRRPPA